MQCNEAGARRQNAAAVLPEMRAAAEESDGSNALSIHGKRCTIPVPWPSDVIMITCAQMS